MSSWSSDDDGANSDEVDLLSLAGLASSQRSAAQSSSSGRSIATTFSSLDRDDVHFFDLVIASLALGDSSFASLKAAYNATVQSRGSQDEQQEDHRWNTLLNLVRVPGRDWSERWDAVRVGLGMDLRNEDTSESNAPSNASQSEDDEATTPQSESTSEWTQEVSQSEGSDGDQSSQTSVEDHLRRRHGPQSSSSSTVTGRDEKRRSRAPNGLSTDLATLRARMDDLTREASQLSLRAGPSEQNQSRRVPLQHQQRPRARQISELMSHVRPETSESDTSPERPTPSSKRIEDLLAAVRASKESLRDAANRRAEESEEAAWAGGARFAQRHHEGRLLSLSWGWWCRRMEKEREREERVDEARQAVVLTRALYHWKTMALGPERSHEDTAIRADRVRAVLSGWRIWRRKVKAVQDQRWEHRKEAMRDSYAIVKEKRQQHQTSLSWIRWRQSLALHRADSFRNGHLLGGAFYLWTIRQDLHSTLTAQEAELCAAQDRNLRSRVLGVWRRKTALSVAEAEWYSDHPASHMREAFGLWRRRANLETLGRAYDANRLLRAGLQAWLQRRAEVAMSRRRQGQADRSRSRRTQKQVFAKWQEKMRCLQSQQQQADQFRNRLDRATASTSFVKLRLASRARLFGRVKEARTQKAALTKWQGNHRRITVSMSSQAAAMSTRNGLRRMALCLHHWQTLATSHKADEAQAIKMADSKLTQDLWRQWRDVSRRSSERHEQAVAFHELSVLRRGWTAMRTQMLESRAVRFGDITSAKLTKRMFTSWRVQKGRRVRDRLIVARFQARGDERTQRDALRSWMVHVIERRAKILQVAEAYNERTVAGALDKWRQSHARVRELTVLADSFVDVRNQDLLRRHNILWISKVRKQQSLRNRLRVFEAQQQDRVARSAIARWYEVWRQDIVLRDAEVEVVTGAQTALQRRMITTWSRKTQVLPALRFRHTRLKKLALTKWRDSVPAAILRRQADERYANVTLGKASRYWLEKVKAKKGARAAARFGGPSMGARIRRHSSRLPSPFFVVKPRRSVSRETTPIEVDDVRQATEMMSQHSLTSPTSLPAALPRSHGAHLDTAETASHASSSTFSRSSRAAKSEVVRASHRPDWPSLSTSTSAQARHRPSSARSERDVDLYSETMRTRAVPRASVASPFGSRSPRGAPTAGATPQTVQHEGDERLDLLEEMRRRRRAMARN